MIASIHTKNFKRVAAALALALIGIAGGTTSSLATDPPSSSEPPKQPAESDSTGAVRKGVRDDFRARIERRLNEAKDAQAKMEVAIAALDRGAPRDEIIALLPKEGIYRAIFERMDRGDDSDRPERRGPGGLGGPPGAGDHDEPRGRPRRDGDDMPPFGGTPSGSGPDRGSRDGDGGRRPFSREATDEDREAIREILSHAAPDLLAKLDELMKQNPETGRRKIGELFPRMRFMLELRQRDPKIYKLRLEDLDLARQSLPLAKEILDLRTKNTPTDDPIMAAKTKELRTLISHQFDNREKIMQAEVESLRERATKQEKTIETMSQTREDVIDRLMNGLIKNAGKPGRFEDMLGPGPGGPGGGGPGGPGGPREGRGDRGPKPKN